ncbi:glycosyl hydrolase [Pseudochryseolinea flava]|uniref:Glycoside hydrolase family 2 protein n=1 Tax=Pseudochryseolinea flava TaxID=2059302 RepID=A0A364Y2R3_9BACT|nr:glycosyl hydrolase [Pseudochryseolinea flava]RAW00989.1 glycoside hydrolase family 2 protein [Pseudochryseolinea flava]
MKRYFLQYLFFALCSISVFGLQHEVLSQPAWSTISREHKPWSRWWWHGSAVTKEGITAELEAFKRAGLGGLEITPIYGVFGTEDRFVNYLSPQWMDLLVHTLREAERLDLGIDMATGTGWPFGGPWVKESDACKTIEYSVYELYGGESLKDKIRFTQPPYLRIVGNQLYEGSVQDESTRVKLPTATLENLQHPIESNRNLQALAIDQVRFARPLKLVALHAYDEKNTVVDLIKKVGHDGSLQWVAPKGKWKIYAVFEGSHGKLVERAGPGGEGNVIDHFSQEALKNYLAHFDSAMHGHDINSLRAFFNDSYEVDDAKGAADWTPTLFEAFKTKHGYDLRDHLPALFNRDVNVEKNERILCDYRETIAELVLRNFTQQWKTWAHEKKAIVRNQAHGSPANILDLYGVVDIPEIEGTEPLRIKMASSSGNVMGKKLVSSESATWLNEHFESNLSDIKSAIDLFLLNGVNHVFYHGTCYSPQDEPWPGWLFYAAVHLNPRNPLWKDFGTLNSYIARSQSILQSTTADHDVLLYMPIYDRFSVHGPEMIEHFDGLGKQFQNTSFEKCATVMHERGYTFDFISDSQLTNSTVEKGKIKTEGGAIYQTIVVPKCKYIPQKTLIALRTLASKGATVIVADGFPEKVSGYADLVKNQKAFEETKSKMITDAKVFRGDELESMLTKANVKRETMVDDGIRFERKKNSTQQSVYFVVNESEHSFEGWISLNKVATSVLLQDAMTGEWGAGKMKEGKDGAAVFVQLTRGQSIFIMEMENTSAVKEFPYARKHGEAFSIATPWTITFEEGGPSLPTEITTSTLSSWTDFSGDGYKAFSGTVKYVTTFQRPSTIANRWLLDLGVVKESASVVLNGKRVGTRIGPTYQLAIDNSLLADQNTLEVYVSNLMANRIADLDRRGVVWKKFYNVNFPARKEENRVHGLFDASHWKPRTSGMLGPVLLQPLGD